MKAAQATLLPTYLHPRNPAMKISTGIISATIGLTSDKIEITNPSLDTIILNWLLAIQQKTVSLRERLLTHAIRKLDQAEDEAEDIKQRLEWSIRQDLDDEADDLRAVISDCNKSKAQAEDRLTSILNYLDPDEFYIRPQVPGVVAAPPAVQGIDEDDAPEGYKAVPWVRCADCAFGARRAVRCPRREEDDDGYMHCSNVDRPDGVEVMFVSRA